MHSLPDHSPFDPNSPHPDLAALSGPMVPLSWLLAALADVEQIAADYQNRQTDIRVATTTRLVDIHADAMREAGYYVRDFIAYLLDPAAYEAEEARRCAAWNKGMEAGQ